MKTLLCIALLTLCTIAQADTKTSEKTDKAADTKPDSTVTAIPLAQAHAHNDYLHKRPLLDALSHGFCSVEADIFLADDELQVGHFRFQLKKGRTLQSLYLEPLRQRIRQNGGSVYKDSKLPFTLLIDLKTNGESTWPTLNKALTQYGDILTSVTDGNQTLGAVSVVISGNRPMQLIAKTNPRFCGVDGRLTDLDSDKPAHLMPLISDNWFKNFQWAGDGPMPLAQRTKLHAHVTKAHAAGRKVRYWATPENENLWKELHAAKVDMLNTDQLERLQTFLTDVDSVEATP